MNYSDELIKVVEDIMAACGTNYSKTASMMTRNEKPMARQSLFKMVKNASLKTTALFEVLDSLGVTVVFKKGGKVIAQRFPHENG